MRSNTRGHIRRGIKAGIQVVQGDASHVDLFFKLMSTLCARRGTSPFPRSAAAFRDLWRCMSKSGGTRLFLAGYQSEVVSAAFTFVFGNVMRVWKVGWTGEHDEHRPNQVMWWEMIRWAKQNGCSRFDFVQLMPEHARALLKGETVQDPYWGVTQFKTGFGGKVLLLPEAYYRSFNPVIQAALRLGGARFLGSPTGLKWVRKLSRSKPARPEA